MADVKDSNSGMAQGSPGVNMGTTGSVHEIDWGTEELYWRQRFGARPYAKADRGYEYYGPAYRYGFEAANRYRGRHWHEVEPEISGSWPKYEHRGAHTSTWDDIKDAVKDAWDRVTGSGRAADEGRR